MKTSKDILERMRKLHPSLIDFSLGRILALLEKMDSPHKKLPPVIHIAGTNGKGSTLAFIRSICEYAGLRVQCFVSPHLVSFHERIQLPGPIQDSRCFPISEQRLIEVLEETEKGNDGADITFFEITAAAAFLAFSRYDADILILETGLGGRLDATNIIDTPALSVITPIALDHMHYLGDTLEKIAGEKAGIIKQDVPCIAAHQDHEVLHVLAEHCLKKSSPLIAAGREWDCYQEHDRMVFQSDSPLLTSGSGVLDLPLPALVGPHQIRNAGTAIAAVLALKNVPALKNHEFRTDDIALGLKNAYWPGRLQRLKAEDFDTCHPQSEIWLDGGHNPAAGAVLAQYMADLEERVPSPLYLICGMMDKKDPKNFLTCFKGLASYTITVPVPGSNPENPHGYNPEKLAEQAQDIDIPAIAAGSVSIAMSHIRTLTENKPVRILITGSLYLAGDVLGKIKTSSL